MNSNDHFTLHYNCTRSNNPLDLPYGTTVLTGQVLYFRAANQQATPWSFELLQHSAIPEAKTHSYMFRVNTLLTLAATTHPTLEQTTPFCSPSPTLNTVTILHKPHPNTHWPHYIPALSPLLGVKR